jgi:hypothetical protein
MANRIKVPGRYHLLTAGDPERVSPVWIIRAEVLSEPGVAWAPR